MGKLIYTVAKVYKKARVGDMTLNGVSLQTPIFMPVGTKATIKGLILDMLRDPFYIGDVPEIKMILANTFHLYLRPGSKLIQKAGGLHQFEQWKDGLILTDSGGFQVFSLGSNNTLKHDGKGKEKKQERHSVGMKIGDDGVAFRSPLDGSKHFFGPEGTVDTQCELGSDIMMMLDVCSPAGGSRHEYKRDMIRTHDWARRQFDHHQKCYDDVRGVLFPIVQGGPFLDLREESIEELSKYAYDGIAVGGVSVGEELSVKRDVIAFCGEKLPQDKPRYLMGIGTPEDILWSVSQGFDMFDCVLATRLGRHGVVFGKSGPSEKHRETPDFDSIEDSMEMWGGRMNLKNAIFREDFSPLHAGCPCYTCRTHSRAYLHHLVREKEMLAGALLSLHNIVYLHWMLHVYRLWILEQ